MQVCHGHGLIGNQVEAGRQALLKASTYYNRCAALACGRIVQGER